MLLKDRNLDTKMKINRNINHQIKISVSIAKWWIKCTPNKKYGS